MSKKKIKKAAIGAVKKKSEKKNQTKNYEISADNVKAALEEWMRARSLLQADEIIYTVFPAIKLDIVKEVLD